jgi:hypothetical protein
MCHTTIIWAFSSKLLHQMAARAYLFNRIGRKIDEHSEKFQIRLLILWFKNKLTLLKVIFYKSFLSKMNFMKFPRSWLASRLFFPVFLWNSQSPATLSHTTRIPKIQSTCIAASKKAHKMRLFNFSLRLHTWHCSLSLFSSLVTRVLSVFSVIFSSLLLLYTHAHCCNHDCLFLSSLVFCVLCTWRKNIYTPCLWTTKKNADSLVIKNEWMSLYVYFSSLAWRPLCSPCSVSDGL